MQHPELSNANALITVGKVAEVCQVYRGTVQRWIALEKVKAHQLPSGHYRIRVGDLRYFMQSNHLPMPVEMTSDGFGRVRILIIDISTQNRNRMRSALDGLDSDIEMVGNGVDGLLKIGHWKPILLIVNPVFKDMDGVKALQRIAINPATKSTRILIACDGAADSIKKKLNRNPCVVGYMNQPMPADALRKQVLKTIGPLGGYKE